MLKTCIVIYPNGYERTLFLRRLEKEFFIDKEVNLFYYNVLTNKLSDDRYAVYVITEMLVEEDTIKLWVEFDRF